jgi:alpha-tubulin suppressor-like RCC1 family protein
VSCWGEAGPWLGYGKAIDNVGIGLGDDEHPSVLGVVDVGGRVVEIAVGDAFSCARLDDGTIKCWGVSNQGQIGYGSTDFIGYEQTPAEVGTLDLGGLAVRLVAGRYHACALLEDGTLRCWGSGNYLGYGTSEDIGDDETPASAGPVPFR